MWHSHIQYSEHDCDSDFIFSSKIPNHEQFFFSKNTHNEKREIKSILQNTHPTTYTDAHECQNKSLRTERSFLTVNKPVGESVKPKISVVQLHPGIKYRLQTLHRATLKIQPRNSKLHYSRFLSEKKPYIQYNTMWFVSGILSYTLPAMCQQTYISYIRLCPTMLGRKVPLLFMSSHMIYF